MFVAHDATRLIRPTAAENAHHIEYDHTQRATLRDGDNHFSVSQEKGITQILISSSMLVLAVVVVVCKQKQL